MNIDVATCSLIGHRRENQDRVALFRDGDTTLLVAVDGMGGHADGSVAAEVAVGAFEAAFHERSWPAMDPLGFMHRAVGRAHDAVADLGLHLDFSLRPRATCAVSLIDRGAAYWAHVGDSRAYHVRGGGVVARTHDHTHVEHLVRTGRLQPLLARHHPLRNYVESCLGGQRALAEMTLSRRRRLTPGDVILVCTDGLWSGLDDGHLVQFWNPEKPVAAILQEACATAVAAAAPASDNTSAAALRWPF